MLSKAKGNWSMRDAKHLLNRAGFGGTPADVAKLHAFGREKAVELFLNPDENAATYPKPEWADLKTALASMQEQMGERRKMMNELRDMTPEEAEKARRKLFQARQKDTRQQGVESQAWWFKRILVTKAPLREKMTLFWHDHFATSIQKVKQPVLLLKQNDLFRDHAFGNFRDLTQQVVKDPAMMLYLDTQQSSKAKPNENFAREVMELFTLGEGNYSEEDVKEAARAFTGYRLNRFNGEVQHQQFNWDGGDKTVFGKKGKFKGEDVIGMIFEKNACAVFMVRKLWDYFAYEAPPEELMADLAETFRDADYELKPVLREIFLSEEFYGEKSIGMQIKCPVQYLVQMLKELEIINPPPFFPLQGQIQLGQVLFMPPNVAGWDWGKAWINTNTLLTRYNLAGMLTKGSGDTGGAMSGMMRDGMAGNRRRGMGMFGKNAAGPEFSKIIPEAERKDMEQLVDGLIDRFFSTPIPAKARASFLTYAESKKGVSFTDKEMGELCHLMMSTPYYQLC
jgi:uncharacterized protein (DUF1800 family)